MQFEEHGYRFVSTNFAAALGLGISDSPENLFLILSYLTLGGLFFLNRAPVLRPMVGRRGK